MIPYQGHILGFLKFLGLSSAALIMFSSWVWADIYWFTDEQGTIHFSNVPQDGRYRFKLKERTTKPSQTLFEYRKRKYSKLIQKVAQNKGLDPELIQAVVEVESGYNPDAVSPKGAVGLMQLMPETGKKMGVKDPFEPLQNVEGGTLYLQQLLKKYGGRLQLALAAYNAGEKAVDRYKGIPPFPETQNYVRKVLKKYRKTF